MHKTANVQGALPKSVHGKAKKDLHAIYQAENRAKAEAAFNRFSAKYGTKYERTANCLAKNRAALLAFYDFPAEPLAGQQIREGVTAHVGGFSLDAGGLA